MEILNALKFDFLFIVSFRTASKGPYNPQAEREVILIRVCLAHCGGLTVQFMSELIWGRSRRKGKKTATQSWVAEMFWRIISLKKIGYYSYARETA